MEAITRRSTIIKDGKIQQTGAGAYYLYLPKEIVALKSLRKGALVKIYDMDYYTAIVPDALDPTKSINKTCDEIPVSHDEDLEVLIRTCYARGKSGVIFFTEDGKEFDPKRYDAGITFLESLKNIRPYKPALHNKIGFLDITNYEVLNPYVVLNEEVAGTTEAILEKCSFALKAINAYDELSQYFTEHWKLEEHELDPWCLFIIRVSSILARTPTLIPDIDRASGPHYLALTSYILERIGDSIFHLISEIAGAYGLKEPLLKYPREWIKGKMEESPPLGIDVIRSSSDFLAPRCKELTLIFKHCRQFMQKCDGRAVHHIFGKSLNDWRQKFYEELPKILGEISSNKIRVLINACASQLFQVSIWMDSLAGRLAVYHYQINSKAESSNSEGESK